MAAQQYYDTRGRALYLRQRVGRGSSDVTVEVAAAGALGSGRWLLLTALLAALLLALPLPAPALCAAAACLLPALAYRARHRVVAERVVLVRGVGAQLSTVFYSGRACHTFLPWPCLRYVVIAESVCLTRVLFYAALLTRHGCVPLFRHLWPRLPCLTAVRRSCQAALAG